MYAILDFFRVRRALSIGLIVLIATAAVIGLGSLAVKGLSSARADAAKNQMVWYHVSAEQRDIITAQSETNATVKILGEKNFTPVRILRYKEKFTAEFRACGNASYTDCLDGSMPKKGSQWIRVPLVSAPVNDNDIRLGSTTVLVYHSHATRSPMVCGTESTWTLTAETYGDVQVVFDNFYNLDYDYGNGYSQVKRVGELDWQCLYGDW